MIEFIAGLLIGSALSNDKPYYKSRQGLLDECLYCTSRNAPECPFHRRDY